MNLFPSPDKFNGALREGFHGQGRATSGIAVGFGKNHACEGQRIVKGFGGMRRVLQKT